MAERKLYSERERREFEERYGKEHGDEVFGEVVGKVKREQLADRGERTGHEEVRPHWATSSTGKRFRVKGHTVTIHAESHGPGHHAGPCDGSCRRGMRPHRHGSRRRRGRR